MGYAADATSSVELAGIAGPGSVQSFQQSEVTDVVTSSQEQLRYHERDEEVETTQSTQSKSLSFKLAFAGLALNLLVFQVDATCLSIALPTISQKLRGTSLESFWANLGYALCALVTQPIWATLSEAFGRKYALHASICLFFIGSIVFATAQSMNSVIAGRVVQGLGGGGLDILSSMAVADMTTLEERSKYLGLISIFAAIGIIMGPFIGALFATYASWRWIGWINLPLLGIAIVLLFFFLKLRPIPLDATIMGNLERLDWIGMLLVTGGITAFCTPVSWAGSLFPWSSWQTLLPLVLGFIILVAFGVYEPKPVAPVIPHRLFKTKTGNMALIGGFIHGIVLVSVLQYLPLFFQAVERKSAISSALIMLPGIIVSVLITAVAMMMVPMFGGYVWLLRLSWAITALGTGILALMHVGSSTAAVYTLPILWGMGVSLLRLLMLPAQASAPSADDEGLATANFTTIRQFGALIGLAIASPIFNAVFSNSISKATVDLTGPLAPLEDASNAINFIDSLKSLDVPAATLDQVLQAYLDCFRAIFYTMAALSGLGLVTSVFLDEIKLTRKERGHQRFEDK